MSCAVRPAAIAKADDRWATPSMIDPAAVAKATKNAKNNVPEKYAKPTTSGLTAVVKEESNTFNYDLTD